MTKRTTCSTRRDRAGTRVALGLAGLTNLVIGEEAVRLGERWRTEPSGAMLVWIGFAAGVVGVVCILLAFRPEGWD
jgi:hypothetical protein